MYGIFNVKLLCFGAVGLGAFEGALAGLGECYDVRAVGYVVLEYICCGICGKH